MKIFNPHPNIIFILILGFAIFTLIGCSTSTKLEPTSSKVQVVEKKIVVGCHIPPIVCNFEGEGYEPTKRLLECVKLQKEAIRLCTELAVDIDKDSEAQKEEE